MQLLPGELALANLKGQVSQDERGFMSKPAALRFLKEISGKDFGLDITRWEAWVKDNYKDRPSKLAD